MKNSCGHISHFKYLILGVFLVSALVIRAQVTLDPCIRATPVKIVILGSSTAAGSGPSSPDSAWVNRYRRSLQSINPQNQVINLAVGGFTTYRIMPDGFVPTLTGRPLPDTTKNISEALRRSPDAIIVNLPSNDRQWPMEEQLNNFDSIYKLSQSYGVPMWICTTQPLGSSSFATYQKNVHDSILAQYGGQSIEFFLPLADANNVLLPQYNSGDNVHLNDAGHRVLWSQVIQKDILKSIVDPKTSTDLALTSFILPGGLCMEDTIAVGVEVVNLGAAVPPGILGSIQADISGLNHLSVLQISDTLGSCSVDTIWNYFSFPQGGIMTLQAGISVSGDTLWSNDSIRFSSPAIMQPSITPDPISLCDPGVQGAFRVSSTHADTVFWYGDLTQTKPIAYGDSLGGITQDSILYVQAVTGDLFFKDRLATPINYNISWNGIMFDLIASDTLHLDSLSFISSNSGAIPLQIFTAPTSHRNVLATPGSWSLLMQDTLNSLAADSRLVIDIPSITLNPGDTLGLYLELQSGKLLRYRSVGNPETFVQNGLSLVTGTGISNNFGATYYPRRFNGEVFFHFGFNPEGDCASDRIRVRVGDRVPRTDIDTVMASIFSPVIFQHPDSLESYHFVFGATGDTLSTSRDLLQDTLFVSGVPNEVWVHTLDSMGCTDVDTLWVIIDLTGLNENDRILTLYPIPASQKIQIPIDLYGEVVVSDLSGRVIFSGEKEKGTTEWDVSMIPEGIYQLTIFNDSGLGTARLVIQRP